MDTAIENFAHDKSYLGSRRIREKRGRSAVGDTPVLGIFQKANNYSKEVLSRIM